MKIKIIENGKQPFLLWLPTRIFCNRLFASFVPLFVNRKLKKYKIKTNGSMCRKFVREFYKTRKHFGGNLELVEVKSADGTFIKITL